MSTSKNQGIFGTLRDDFREGGFFDRVKGEFQAIRDFYLDEEDRERLMKKGKIARWFVLSWWILKKAFFRLTPVRRLLLIAGIVLIYAGNISVSGEGYYSVNLHYRTFGLILILFVLVLELKDKLVAHAELESGRAVQRSMAPPCSPSAPGWDIWLFTRPANEVGGDLVDFVALGGATFGIALGDVAGKGLGAALFMVKIQSTLRALAPDFDSLSRLSSKMNEILIRDGMPSKFASLFFARITGSTGTVRYVNAGHIPPLLLRSSGVSELPKGNTALGLALKSEYADEEVTLAAGEYLIAYSDGVTEAQNESSQFFGPERLKNLCGHFAASSARELGERIVAEVDRFVGDARGKDDLSLAILHKQG